ncbi:MAG TPA: response regulator [Candidatus Tectomicrobia bacterium]|jgi:CheY-like chemotaxis protein
MGVESTPGQGSTFWFTVRLARRSAPVEAICATLPELRGVRVLCVDDNATNRTILEAQLSAWGMQTDCVASGASALARLRAAHTKDQPYTLAILACQMPEMDGLELARSIKADPLLAPIRLIMLSSVSQHGQRSAAQQVGITSCLTKPVRQSYLYNCVIAVLGAAASSTGIAPVSYRQEYDRTPMHVRVLVVEDNVINQKVAVRLLEKLGCRIDVAANGREAVTMLAELAYDVVLMDCQMPEMDGFAATTAIRHREVSTGRHVPIIAMTANAMQGDREECLVAGMDDYLSKPVTFDALAATLRKWAPPPVTASASPQVTAPPESLVMPIAQPAVLDAEAFAALQALGGNEAVTFLLPMVEQFVQDAAAHLATLQAAADTGDAVALERAAHTLKSTSATVGALRMTAICSELQQLGRTGSVAGAAGHIEQLVNEFACVQQALAQVCSALRGTAVPL